MFGTSRGDQGYLFSSGDLRLTLEGQVNALRKEVEDLDQDRLLNTAPTDLVRYLVERYQVEPVVIKPKDDWSSDEQEIQVDVRNDPHRMVRDRSRPALVPGQRIEIFIPFDGEAGVLKLRPATYSMNPPRGAVRGSEIVLSFEFPQGQEGNLDQEIQSQVEYIRSHLAWSEEQILTHNRSLERVAAQTVEARRGRLLANRGRLASLGIRARARDNAPTTYALPTVRRKAPPTLPPASSTPWEPEPTWAMEHYEHALNVIQNMTHVMERSPDAFKGMSEEDLRQHFLVQLNGQFEGNATGETFNASGKTDILLREKDRNAFIAECKFWGGPKKFRDTIDQLLSYQSWRDTKTAILIFNRDTAMSTVLAAIPKQIQEHPNYKQTLSYPHESGFRYVFHQNGDPNRELILTVLVFDVPGHEK